MYVYEKRKYYCVCDGYMRKKFAEWLAVQSGILGCLFDSYDTKTPINATYTFHITATP